MGKNLVLEPAADEAADIEAALRELVAEIRYANKEMARDQEEIDQLKVRTREILTKLETSDLHVEAGMHLLAGTH